LSIIMREMLKDKVAIVTGSGRGIGRGVAELFAERGACVIVATRTVSHGQATVEAIAAAGGRASLFVTELGDRAEIERLVEATIAQYGGLDIMVHNAALPLLAPLENITDEVLERSFNLNLKASVWLTQASVAPMRKRGGGRILFTSSITAQRAIRGAATYAMCKAGLHGWIRSAAYELARDEITVNGVEPGLIWTDAMKKHNYRPGEIEQIMGTIPIARKGQPRDIAEAMAYLASDGASYVTGQTLVVDGGALLPESGALMLQGR